MIPQTQINQSLCHALEFSLNISIPTFSRKINSWLKSGQDVPYTPYFHLLRVSTMFPENLRQILFDSTKNPTKMALSGFFSLFFF